MNAIVAAALRRDLNSFVRKSFQTILPGTTYLPNWHIYAIVHQLMRVHAGDISRLLINQPPRSLKSICVSVAFVAWLMGHDPTRRIIVVSYSNELAVGEDTLPALNPARLLLAVCDPELSQVPRPNMLTDMFRLAPAEARVAIGIPAGRQLAEIAADRGVKIETVRAHSRCSPKVIALSGE